MLKVTRYIALITILINFGIVGIARAQAIYVPVRFVIEKGDFKSSRVDIVNKTDGTTNSLGGKPDMNIALKPGCEYVLEFNKRGYITKKISFNTNIPANRIKQGMDDFPFEIHLFPQVDDVNLIVFNQPVGIIKFNRMIDDLDFDTDYTKQIRSAIKEAEDEIMKKADEIALNEKKLAEEEKKEAKKRSKNDDKQESASSDNVDLNDSETNLTITGGARDNEPNEDTRDASFALQGEDPNDIAQGFSGEDERLGGRGFADSDIRSGEPGIGADDETRKRIMAQGHSETDEGVRYARGFSDADTYDGGLMASLNTGPVSVKSNETGSNLSSEPGKKVDVVKEGNRTITKITVKEGSDKVLYSKVVYSWGACYYFKESTSISKLMFKQATGLE